MKRACLDLKTAIEGLLNPRDQPRSALLLEAALDQVEHASLDFHSFIEVLISTSFWIGQDSGEIPVERLCLELAEEIDRLALKHIEPAYHSRHHFQDVCLMLSYLLLQQQVGAVKPDSASPWYISGQEAWILLLAAIAHDFSHPGLINQSPYEIEQQSLQGIKDYLATSSVKQDICQQILKSISPLILATDHAFYQNQLNRVSVPNSDHQDCLAMLLIEADLLSSILPKKGIELTYRLSQEWDERYPDKAVALRNEVGYLSFLGSLQFLSPQAIAAKIPQILNDSVLELRSRL